MPQNGFEEMDKRADAVAASSWRGLALIAFGAVATKMFLSRMSRLFGKGPDRKDAPK